MCINFYWHLRKKYEIPNYKGKNLVISIKKLALDFFLIMVSKVRELSFIFKTIEEITVFIKKLKVG